MNMPRRLLTIAGRSSKTNSSDETDREIALGLRTREGIVAMPLIKVRRGLISDGFLVTNESRVSAPYRKVLGDLYAEVL